MKTPLNILCAIMLLCIFSACGRNASCPDLNENILSWFPYEEGGVIRLENKTAGTLWTVPIGYVEIDHTSHYNTGNDCGHCDDEIRISSKDADFSISVSIEKNKITSERYKIGNVSFYGSPTMLENYIFNDKKYEQVKIFENTNSSKLIVARNFGIIGFIDEDGEEWLLVENNVMRQIKAKIIDVSC